MATLKSPEARARDGVATEMTAKAMWGNPEALRVVYRALGRLQRAVGGGGVVYVKGGLCLTLAALAARSCLETGCDEFSAIDEFLTRELEGGCLTPSDIDVNVVRVCDASEGGGADRGMLSGFGRVSDAPGGRDGGEEEEEEEEARALEERRLIASCWHVLLDMNRELAACSGLWSAISDGAMSETEHNLEVRGSGEEVNVSFDPVRDEVRVETQMSRTDGLVRTANSHLKHQGAGFTLLRSKVRFFQDVFHDSPEAPLPDAPDSGDADRKTYASGEVLDIALPDRAVHGCVLPMSALRPLRVQMRADSEVLAELHMMTPSSVVKDVLLCLLSTPEVKGEKRLRRLALACGMVPPEADANVEAFAGALAWARGADDDPLPDEIHARFDAIRPGYDLGAVALVLRTGLDVAERFKTMGEKIRSCSDGSCADREGVLFRLGDRSAVYADPPSGPRAPRVGGGPRGGGPRAPRGGGGPAAPRNGAATAAAIAHALAVAFAAAVAGSVG